MKKKTLKIIMLCTTFFLLGFIVMIIGTASKALPDAGDYHEAGTEQLPDTGDMFSKKYYSIKLSDENDNIFSIERTARVEGIPEEQLYTEKDIKRIMESLLGVTGEIHQSLVDGQVISYDEYENGMLTGKAASVTYDGIYIQYIVLRNGKVNGAKSSEEFADKREAYDKAIEAIKSKYSDKKIVLREVYKEDEFSVFYDPHSECYRYMLEVEGAIEGKWEDEEYKVIFNPMINVNDLNDIEIASSLGY